MTHTYQLVDHPKSGEVYALQLRDDAIIGLCGPLDQDDREYAERNGLADFEFDITDVDWAEGIEWRPHYEPNA